MIKILDIKRVDYAIFDLSFVLKNAFHPIELMFIQLLILLLKICIFLVFNKLRSEIAFDVLDHLLLLIRFYLHFFDKFVVVPAYEIYCWGIIFRDVEQGNT